MVVLKPLTDALADGDRIRCVILGGAINNDGGGAGLTAPSQLAQQQVIERACAQAGVAPADLDYVELHGTGTPVGDPIEAAALGGRPRRRPDDRRCRSVRSRPTSATWRARPASPAWSRWRSAWPTGAAGQPQLRPAADPASRWTSSAWTWSRQRRDWSRPDRQLLAGVSSFGMGGTNCHLVVAEYRQPVAESALDTEPAGLPWLLSARSATALQAQASQLRAARRIRRVRRGGTGPGRHSGPAGAPGGAARRRPGRPAGRTGRRPAARRAGGRQGRSPARSR